MTQILQGKNSDIIQGLDFIKILLKWLHSKWHHDAALALATTVQVGESKPHTGFKMSAKENHPLDSTSEFYKRSLTITIADEVCAQLKRRFTEDNSIVFEGLRSVQSPFLQGWLSLQPNFQKGGSRQDLNF